MHRLALIPIAAILATLGACGTDPGTGPSAGPTPPATTSSAPPSTTFGPQGYDGVELGMTRAQARRAGAVVTRQGGCDNLALPGVGAGVGGGLVSPRSGVALLQTGDRHVATPEGVHPGSTLAEVRAAYPHLRRAPDFWAVAVPGHPGTSYWLGFRHGRLGGLTLVLDRQDCVN